MQVNLPHLYPSQAGYYWIYLLAEMWSQSRRLGLETYSRLVSITSWTKSSTSQSRLSLGPMHLWSHLGAICLGLGPEVSSRVSGHCVSSRRFVQACAVHTVAAIRAILTSITFCGLDIFVSSVFTLLFTYLS